MEEKKKKRESTFGIDFGTSNTVVTYFMRDRIVCYQNQDNLPFVQSIVALSSANELLIGRAANKVAKPLFRARNVKYLLGKVTPECQDISDVYYEADLGDSNGEPILVYKSKDKKIAKTPEEIVTNFIRVLKAEVERKTGREFTDVVLTVPTTYRTRQKTALKRAARYAGLNVAGVYSEPTAAGLHYQLSMSTKPKGVFLVFDFGGGTLDLSLMYCKDNVYTTLASAGNHHLGGNDINKVIMEYVETTYRTDYGEPLFEGNSVSTKKRRDNLNQGVEEAKIRLQEVNDCIAEISYEDDTGEPLSLNLTNAQLDKLISHQLSEVKDVLKDLAKHFVKEYDNKSVGGFHVSKDDDPEGTLQAIVSSVILVGGSSKLRSVQRLLRDYFGDIIFVDDDTQLCVSKGAMEAMFMIDDPLKSVREVLFHALVVKADGKAIGTVPRGTSIPFATQWCARQQRNRSTIQVAIYEVDKESEEEKETLLVEGTVPVERSFAQMQPYLQAKVDVNVEGVITAVISNPLTGFVTVVGTADLWRVC